MSKMKHESIQLYAFCIRVNIFHLNIHIFRFIDFQFDVSVFFFLFYGANFTPYSVGVNIVIPS